MGLKPVLKWVGGKRRLSREIINLILNEMCFDVEHSTYFEPFLGGGAVFFNMISNHVNCKNAIVGDTNEELIITMNQIKSNHKELVKSFYDMAENYYTLGPEYYYEIRKMDRESDWKSKSDLLRATRMLFLNRFGFNGVYRVNQQGFFNVPLGKNTYKTQFESISPITENYFSFLAKKFNENNINFLNIDYNGLVKNAKKGDVVYFDPPYMPISETSDFTAYTKEGFTYDDQIRLLEVADNLCSKGVGVILSNSDNEQLEKKYLERGFKVVKKSMTRSINSDTQKRKPVSENIFYKIPPKTISFNIRFNFLEKKVLQADDLENKTINVINLLYSKKTGGSELLSKTEFEKTLLRGGKEMVERQKSYYLDAIYLLDLIKHVDCGKKTVQKLYITNDVINIFSDGKLDNKKFESLFYDKLKFYGEINSESTEEYLMQIFSDFIPSKSTLSRRVRSILKWINYFKKVNQ